MKKISLEFLAAVYDFIDCVCIITTAAAVLQLGYAAFIGKAFWAAMVVFVVVVIAVMKFSKEDSTTWMYALSVGAMLTAMEVQPVDELHLCILVIVAPYVGWRVSQQWGRQQSWLFALIITILAPAGLYAMVHMSFTILNVVLMVNFTTSLIPLFYVPKPGDIRWVNKSEA